MPRVRGTPSWGLVPPCRDCSMPHTPSRNINRISVGYWGFSNRWNVPWRALPILGILCELLRDQALYARI